MTILEKLKTALNLNQKTIKQSDIIDKHNRYACLFTCYYMLITQYFGVRRSMAQYKITCMNAQAMREDFYVLDHQKMLSCVGIDRPLRIVRNNLHDAIYQSLLRARPVIVSLAGRHWESIDGWEIVRDKFAFTVDDPGFQNDTHCDCETLEMFRVENGKRVYSKHPDGSRRKVTTAIVVV